MLLVIFTIVGIVSLYFYSKLSIKKCECKTSMQGKVVIVTGANSGIGYHTAKKLAALGARTILACRNEKRGLSAQESIIAATGNTDVTFKQMDLSDLDSVRRFAQDILEKEDRVDVLVNNAGAYTTGDQYTKDGILKGMQVNHCGPFLLTILLLPLLKKSTPSRIVNVSSLIYLFGCVNLDTLNDPKANKTFMYAESKLCNLIFHQELARRLDEYGVVVNSVHPGIIRTNLLNEGNFFVRLFFEVLCWFSARTAEDGSQTVVHVCVAKECERVTGKLFVDCKQRSVLSKINNRDIGENLWRVTEKLVRHKEENKIIMI